MVCSLFTVLRTALITSPFLMYNNVILNHSDIVGVQVVTSSHQVLFTESPAVRECFTPVVHPVHYNQFLYCVKSPLHLEQGSWPTAQLVTTTQLPSIVDACSRHCRSGHKYFGIDSGSHCWCARRLPRAKIVKKSLCLPCSDQKQLTCGNVLYGMTSVYKILYGTLPKPQPTLSVEKSHPTPQTNHSHPTAKVHPTEKVHPTPQTNHSHHPTAKVHPTPQTNHSHHPTPARRPTHNDTISHRPITSNHSNVVPWTPREIANASKASGAQSVGNAGNASGKDVPWTLREITRSTSGAITRSSQVVQIFRIMDERMNVTLQEEKVAKALIADVLEHAEHSLENTAEHSTHAGHTENGDDHTEEKVKEVNKVHEAHEREDDD